MEFSNLFFLYLFLPLCVGMYFLAPGMKLKNGVLILFSLLFYGFGNPVYVPLLFLIAGFHFYFPRLLSSRGLALVIVLAVDLGTMVFFKLRTESPFPLGLSFYLFSLISYQIEGDSHLGRREDSFWRFLLFVSFFPKMVMGPILRYSQVSAELTERNTDPEKIFRGCLRFFTGLGKKVLLADPLFRLYEQLGTHSSSLAPWCAALAFMLYIYLEFSGYADMAVGLGGIFGFTLPENFYRPYSAKSVGEFWRRWHMTLGSFFRDYVYIPLGGNRKGLPRQIYHLFSVWILTGLWHGFSWTFVIWGLYFFFLLSAEKLLFSAGRKVPPMAGRALTLVFVYFGWILFGAEDVPSLIQTLGRMFTLSLRGIEPTLLVLRNSSLLCILSIFVSVPGPVLKDKFRARVKKLSPTGQRLVAVSQGICVVLLLILCTVSLIGAEAKPSMYAGF